MKITIAVVCIALTLVGIVFMPNSSAQEAVIPSWVKNTAGWWATDAISETEFVNALEFLIKEGIINVDKSIADTSSKKVPEWVKNTRVD